MLKFQVVSATTSSSCSSLSSSASSSSSSSSHSIQLSSSVNLADEALDPSFVFTNFQPASNNSSFEGSPGLVRSKKVTFRHPFSSSSETKSNSNSTDEHGLLRVFTSGIKTDTDYKTLKITCKTTTKEVIEELVHEKFRLSFKDLNLFQLFMEVRTKGVEGKEVRSLLELDKTTRPLELQKCHPENMSRFILSMVSNAILARIYDGEICPQSNYKSVLISRQTTCAEALDLILQMCRISSTHYKINEGNGRRTKREARKTILGLESITDFRLFVSGNGKDAQIPPSMQIAGVYLSLLPNQKIILRRVVVPTSEDRNMHNNY